MKATNLPSGLQSEPRRLDWWIGDVVGTTMHVGEIGHRLMIDANGSEP